MKKASANNSYKKLTLWLYITLSTTITICTTLALITHTTRKKLYKVIQQNSALIQPEKQQEETTNTNTNKLYTKLKKHGDAQSPTEYLETIQTLLPLTMTLEKFEYIHKKNAKIAGHAHKEKEITTFVKKLEEELTCSITIESLTKNPGKKSGTHFVIQLQLQ